ncbi:hypothetical protein BJF78_14830 [Pseudonocardia sp. CNS-139]|nr:hypothetical protein BJF78_14830 [Pseudonocardia sp. CNS-139]
MQRKSRSNRSSTSPLWSPQSRRRPQIHAAVPTGESASAYASVCGSVRCTVEWLTIVGRARAVCSTIHRSSGPKSASVTSHRRTPGTFGRVSQAPITDSG